jgi:hypothetical protein
MRPFVRLLSISPTSDHFLPKVKLVGFCISILLSVSKIKIGPFVTKFCPIL